MEMRRAGLLTLQKGRLAISGLEALRVLQPR